jgi:hypothetical protein
MSPRRSIVAGGQQQLGGPLRQQIELKRPTARSMRNPLAEIGVNK